MAFIEFIALSHWYEGDGGGRVHALRDISLRIEEGEFVCVTGPSRSGKSTLLNLLGALDTPGRGTYCLEGRKMRGLRSNALALLRRRIFGFVFQTFDLLDTATALENVEMPARYAGLPRAARRKQARTLLAKVGLEDYAARLPVELSGGEQQRVAIARALMNGGRVILADEPTSALDSESATQVLDVLEELSKSGHTVVVATHNQKIASRFRRCVELLEGRLISDSSKERVRPRRVAAVPPGSPLTNGVQQAIRIGLETLRDRIRCDKRLGVVLPALGIALAVWVGGLAFLLGEGIYARVVQAVNQMGMETITVMRTGKTGLDGNFAWLTRSDATAIENEIPGVRAVSRAKFWPSVYVRRGDVAFELNLVGVIDRGTQGRRGYTGYRLAAGESITPQDDELMERVAVLDAAARDRLFPPNADPVGQEIYIKNTPFLVKGVYEYRTGLVSGAPADIIREQEDILNSNVHLPFSTSYALFAENDRVFWIYVFLENPERLFEVENAIKDLGIRRYGEDVYFVEHWGESYQQAQRQRDSLRFGLGSLAGIVLVAVNFSVMAIMLAATRARRREIGIRMAVGARRSDIFVQFLTEALAISTLGGALGMVLVLVCIPALNALGYPPGFPPFVWVPLAIAFLFGFAFSIAPARRAARLTPVAALSPE